MPLQPAVFAKILNDYQAGRITEDALFAFLRETSADPENMQYAAVLAEQLQARSGFPPTYDIADSWTGERTRFSLLWPLTANTARALPLPFEELDPKSQFFALSADFSAREHEASLAVSQGDLDGGTAILKECVARADQIGLREGRSRALQGLADIAQKRGHMSEERDSLQMALQSLPPSSLLRFPLRRQLAMSVGDSGDLPQAAYDLKKSLRDVEAATAFLTGEAAWSRISLATLLRLSNRPLDALAQLDAALELASSLSPSAPGRSGWQSSR